MHNILTTALTGASFNINGIFLSLSKRDDGTYNVIESNGEIHHCGTLDWALKVVDAYSGGPKLNFREAIENSKIIGDIKPEDYDFWVGECEKDGIHLPLPGGHR
jgi:hypothetical protein